MLYDQLVNPALFEALVGSGIRDLLLFKNDELYVSGSYVQDFVGW